MFSWRLVPVSSASAGADWNVGPPAEARLKLRREQNNDWSITVNLLQGGGDVVIRLKNSLNFYDRKSTEWNERSGLWSLFRHLSKNSQIFVLWFPEKQSLKPWMIKQSYKHQILTRDTGIHSDIPHSVLEKFFNEQNVWCFCLQILPQSFSLSSEGRQKPPLSLRLCSSRAQRLVKFSLAEDFRAAEAEFNLVPN